MLSGQMTPRFSDYRDWHTCVVCSIFSAFSKNSVESNPVEEHFIKFNVSPHIHKCYILITKVQKFPYWDLGIQ